MAAHAEQVGVVPVPLDIIPVRLAAFDWLRGIVMLLMAVDHSSGAFNRGRFVTDSVALFKPGTPIPVAQFLTRWITHLCAPSFVFLAGVSLAISLGRRRERGESPGSLDRHLLTRGVIIVACELVPSYFWMPPGHYLLQVLYAIGTAYLWMIPLRRLPTPLLLGLAAAVLLGGEALIAAAGWGSAEKTPWLAALLLVAGPRGSVIVAYPTLPWLAILLLGWVFGAAVRKRPEGNKLRASEFALAGSLLLAVFVAVRAANAYGNMGLFREGGALVQWLHVSKYPPSITYVALELGLMALVLAGLTLKAEQSGLSDRSFLVVFGQTPLFFYLLHIPLLDLLARGLHVEHALGLGAAYGFALVAALLLYPLCRFYRRYKAEHPASLARFF